ncbi:pyruvate dehydrogenase complex E1 component subunit beta [Nocardioides sp. AE5]|uniref:alpha-ketoacid dehydrogenase subunit beta n=1 Tax=Nocardioides sp. AE5 TaxID=2962573 RepID=UPI002881E6C1|nr:pyruvate dehydrogenase complex E1 component subunit beta [Nocardioides sp. AE5]MDT0203159.1 pyruvate dehydrogenase complex E1 component subunit beta [Nocardioides sp. AE5]
MSVTTYKEAIRQAQADALKADPTVFLLGEDIAAAGGAFKVTDGLMESFGGERVMDTPISEQAIIGAAIGAAIMGSRPVAELMFADFAGVCFDQIANQLAKYRYMSGGQVSVPVTVRLANGAGQGFASQHSQPVENWFLNCPGLKIVTPGSVEDAYGLLRSAIADEDPVLFFEHKAMYNLKRVRTGELAPVPIGQAEVVREGGDVTVVATQLMRQCAERAAEQMADLGVTVEVIDPRTLVPFDYGTVAESVAKTNRLIVMQEGSAGGSWGATVVARIAGDCFESLDLAPVLISAPDTPVPYAGGLEAAWLPDVDTLCEAIKAMDRY